MPGRPRAFDEDEVLERAQQFFLQEGFEAAAYERLAASVGLSKPSLYNAFGDKGALFERVIAGYARNAHTLIVASFMGAGSLADGGRRLLLAAADFYSRPDGPSTGCLLVGTALPACAHLDGARDTLAEFIASLEASLEHGITTRYATDARRTGKTPRALALQLASLLFSLAVRARTGISRRKLRTIAAELGDLYG
jgi:AcrR family transcriptional regulator